ncbi:MAG: MATE family efflux transporter, partial [Hyphomicrobiaceae bacterium]
MTATTAKKEAGAPAAPHPLTTSPILPTLVRLSIPNVFAMLATAVVASAETVYVGCLGLVPLAAVALAFPAVRLQQMMSAGAMGGGVSSAVSRALGAGDVVRAEALAWHATVIGLLAGVAFMIIFLCFGGVIYGLLGGTGQALSEALLYSDVVFAGSITVWLMNTWASVIRGTGNMRLPSAVLFWVAVLQVVIGGVLGLGVGPIPRFGMAGIGMGQLIAFSAGAVFLGWYLVLGDTRVRLRVGGSLEWAMFRDILKVGALACVSPVQTVLTVLIMTALVAHFGTEALA